MPEIHGPIRIEIYKSRSLNPKQRWRWRVKAANGRNLANSGEGYSRREDAVEMANYIVVEGHLNADGV